jgi:hypothetical protein
MGDADLRRRLRVLQEGLELMHYTPEDAALRIHEAYALLVRDAEAAARETGVAFAPPTDDDIVTFAIYGEEKARAVKAFHEQRNRRLPGGH